MADTSAKKGKGEQTDHTRGPLPPPQRARTHPHDTTQEPRTLAFSKWLYHLRQRFEKRPRAFEAREMTVAEIRSEVPKKLRPK